jgi:thiol-disulfide isomerase/thioredoxin
MKHWPLLLFTFVLSACASSGPADQAATKSEHPDLGLAPDLAGDVLLNTSAPLRLADLRGKVVLVEMWTFDCINCKNVIPSVRDWHEKYASDGLVVIGNHYPEFNYEADLDNLKQAVVNLNVPYPVVQDNTGVNWRAFNTRAWPTLYLIDKQGHLRYTHIGEGRFSETETAIKTLLAETVQ